VPGQRSIQAGDHLTKIAEQLGLPDTETILSLEANAPLRDRPHPEMLDPGELVTLPDVEPLQFTLATGKRHELTIHRLKPKLRVAFTTFAGRSVTATEAEVKCAGRPAETKGLADGELEMPIPPTCPLAEVELPASVEGRPAVRWRLRLGYLRRNESDEGAFARLRNLGYYRQVAKEAETRERRSAIEEFQFAQALPLTGTLDDATRAKIEEIYGC
jgi:hypothetical protein